MFNKTFLLGMTGTVSAHYHPSPHEYCERLCHENRECREDPHAHGSYCKLDHHPTLASVCITRNIATTPRMVSKLRSTRKGVMIQRVKMMKSLAIIIARGLVSNLMIAIATTAN